MKVPVYYRRLVDGDKVREYKFLLSPSNLERRRELIRRIMVKRHLTLYDKFTSLGDGVVQQDFIPDFSDTAVLIRWNEEKLLDIILSRI
jgi:hypothetical protein